MNRLGTHEKADMFSAVQTVMTLTAIPSGYLTGLIYNHSPLSLFVVVLGLYAALMIVVLFLPLPAGRQQIVDSSY